MVAYILSKHALTISSVFWTFGLPSFCASAQSYDILGLHTYRFA